MNQPRSTGSPKRLAGTARTLASRSNFYLYSNTNVEFYAHFGQPVFP
ncbi:hypothetical protein [Glutamicibacter endophyticus]